MNRHVNDTAERIVQRLVPVIAMLLMPGEERDFQDEAMPIVADEIRQLLWRRRIEAQRLYRRKESDN